jgi:hypothetical protein
MKLSGDITPVSRGGGKFLLLDFRECEDRQNQPLPQGRAEGVMSAFLKMKKLDIAAIERAYAG